MGDIAIDDIQFTSLACTLTPSNADPNVQPSVKPTTLPLTRPTTVGKYDHRLNSFFMINILLSVTLLKIVFSHIFLTEPFFI